MADDCLFCQIVAGQVPSTKVRETDSVLAFEDINPAAPTHVLVIPKQHIASARDIDASNAEILAEMFETMAAIADERGIAEAYRVVSNVGAGAGQSVFHLHFHLVGGRELSWPPG